MMEEETFSSEEMNQSSVTWEMGQRGSIGFKFKEVLGKPLTEDFLTKNEATLDKLIAMRMRKIIDLKVQKENREALE